jgi:hypothetical protein
MTVSRPHQAVAANESQYHDARLVVGWFFEAGVPGDVTILACELNWFMRFASWYGERPSTLRTFELVKPFSIEYAQPN